MTSSREYFGTGSTDYSETRYFYDTHGRLKLVKSYSGGGTLVPPLTAYNYDNANRITATATYSADPNTGAATDAVSTTTSRVSLSQTSFDRLGRVYQSETDSIASDGTIELIGGSQPKKLVTRFFYDPLGLLVATDVSNGGVLISKPDGAGRIVESWVCSQMDPNVSAMYSSGAFNYANSNIRVLEKTVSTLNATGDVITVTHSELDHDQTGGSGSTTSVSTYTWNFYDAAGRLSGSAYYGTNNSDWSTGSAPTPTSMPSRSDSVLVTSYDYDIASRVATVTDPKGIVTGYAYDNLDRVTQVTESQGGGGSDLNRQTKYTYDNLSNVKKIAAGSVADYNGDSTLDDQTTEYVRGSALDSDWVTEIHYPDPNSGAASSDPNNVVAITYSNDGAVATRTDQIGNVITYEYDDLRRLQKQKAATTGTTDSAIRRIEYTYNNAGQLQKVASYDDPNAGTKKNEVALTYDGFGKLTKDEQAHDGSTGSAPSIQYGYAHSSSSDESTDRNYFDRLSDIIYPNGRYVWYDYSNHSTTGIGTINNLLSRVGRVDDGTSGGASYVIAEYSFNGLSRMVQRDHPNLGSGTGKPGNKTALRMIRQTSDSGALYPDFDPFGRIISMRHLAYTTGASDTGAPALSKFQYGYDRNSNRTYANFATNKSRSRVYGYDNLNRLVSDKLGIPNSTNSDMLASWTKPAEQDWSLDVLGNWAGFDRKSTDNSASESRTHNATNEIKTRTPAAEAAKYWVKDSLTTSSTDVLGWVSAAPAALSSWSIASSKLQCDGVDPATGCPIGSGNGAIYLIDQSKFQDFQLSVVLTLSSTAQNGGLVFGYVDEWNFWVLTADRGTSGSRKYKLYQVTGDSGSGRTWNLRRSGGSVSSSGGTFNLRCEVRSGSVEGMTSLTLGDYNPSSPIPAGQVGVWAGSDSATVKFSDFRVLNMAAAAEVDGRWYDDAGDTSLASGKLQMNVVTGMGSTGIEKHALRRGFRGSKFVLEFDGPVSSSADLGAILHYQNPENFMAVVFSVEEGSSYSPLLLRRKGGVLSTIASNSPFTMTSGDRVRLAIHNDPNHAELQELKVYVNGTLRLSSDKIDDDWSGGAVGLITRNASVSASFDNVKIGFDNNANDDVDDGGDTVLVNDDFASGTITLSHDLAGNLTDDGVFQYVYDAWNRLVGVKTSQGSHATIATYSYDGLNRRVRKVVTNTGAGVADQSDAGGLTGIQAGDKTEDYYYAGWRVLEERDGEGRTLAQTVYGTQYIDEPICRDRNTNLSTNNDCVDSGGSQRYFYQQDANYRVVALTNEAGGVVERYEYEAYGEPRIYQGAGSGSELGYLMQVSGVGNALLFQGLRFDDESESLNSRCRQLNTRIGRYLQQDPLEYLDALNRYIDLLDNSQFFLDPLGECAEDWLDWFKRMYPRGEAVSPQKGISRSIIIVITHDDDLAPDMRTYLKALENLLQQMFDRSGLTRVEIYVLIYNTGRPFDFKDTYLDFHESWRNGTDVEQVTWVQNVAIDDKSAIPAHTQGHVTDFHTSAWSQGLPAKTSGEENALSLANAIAHEVFFHGLAGLHDAPTSSAPTLDSTGGATLQPQILTPSIANGVRQTLHYPPNAGQRYPYDKP